MLTVRWVTETFEGCRPRPVHILLKRNKRRYSQSRRRERLVIPTGPFEEDDVWTTVNRRIEEPVHGTFSAYTSLGCATLHPACSDLVLSLHLSCVDSLTDQNVKIASRRRHRTERSIATVRPPTQIQNHKFARGLRLTHVFLFSRLRIQERIVLHLRETDSGYDRLPDVQQVTSLSFTFLGTGLRNRRMHSVAGGGLSFIRRYIGRMPGFGRTGTLLR